MTRLSLTFLFGLSFFIPWIEYMPNFCQMKIKMRHTDWKMIRWPKKDSMIKMIGWPSRWPNGMSYLAILVISYVEWRNYCFFPSNDGSITDRQAVLTNTADRAGFLALERMSRQQKRGRRGRLPFPPPFFSHEVPNLPGWGEKVG